MKLVAGSSNPELAQTIARKMDITQVEVDISSFANGEKKIWIKNKVRGENVVLVQDFSHTTEQPITEFLLLADALERLGARHVNLVMPWMGYSLQDKIFRAGEPISAKVMANLISSSYIKRIFLLDLHNSSTTGFFSIPTQHLSAIELFVDYVKTNFTQLNPIVASPDFGGLKRSRVFADKLQLDLVNIDKHRDLTSGHVMAMDITAGTVIDKDVLVFDDCIVSGSTGVEAARILKESGAKSVHFFATHGPLVPEALAKLEKSELDDIIVTNSIRHHHQSHKLKVIDVSGLFAESLNDWK